MCVMLCQIFMTLQTEILSTETSDFLKQIIFNSHLIQCYLWLCKPTFTEMVCDWLWPVQSGQGPLCLHNCADVGEPILPKNKDVGQC